VRIERAIDAFLDWRQLERDATARSLDSYQRILWKLARDYPEADIRALTTVDLRAFLKGWVDESKRVRGVDLSAATRSNIISVLHSFFGWAESEDVIESDPSRKIRRPRKRRPEVYRPSLEELQRVRTAAVGYERPPVLLMEGVGLRRAEVVRCRWVDIDLVRGRVHVLRKGGHRNGYRSLLMCWPSFGRASGDFGLSLTTTFSPWRSNNGSRTTNGYGGGRIRRRRRATRRSCGWSGASASGPGFGLSRLTSCDTASQIASFGRAAATSSRSRP
jgi:integrase